MSVGGSQQVEVSRRIDAPASAIFRVLADPEMHTVLDGTAMLRGAVTTGSIRGLGDVFVMKMHYLEYGDYEMNNHVVEFELNRRIGWEPEAGRGHPGTAAGSTGPTRLGHRWSYDLQPDGPHATVVTEIYDCSATPADFRAGMQGGRIWLAGMTETLDRLASVCEALARPV
jgi:hypothetical protein